MFALLRGCRTGNTGFGRAYGTAAYTSIAKSDASRIGGREFSVDLDRIEAVRRCRIAMLTSGVDLFDVHLIPNPEEYDRDFFRFPADERRPAPELTEKALMVIKPPVDDSTVRKVKTVNPVAAHTKALSDTPWSGALETFLHSEGRN